MESSDLLETILKPKTLIGSRDINTLIKICLVITYKVVNTQKQVVLVDEKNIVSRYIPIELLDKITLLANPDEACSQKPDYLLVFYPRRIRKLLQCRASSLIILHRYTGIQIPGFAKYVVKRVPGTSEYILKSLDTNYTVRFEFTSNGIKEVNQPAGLKGEAYRILKNALSTYGEITIKDAVLILSKELGVDRKTARSILLELARSRYIGVYKGRVGLV